jgi:hypothetical protein
MTLTNKNEFDKSLKKETKRGGRYVTWQETEYKENKNIMLSTK